MTRIESLNRSACRFEKAVAASGVQAAGCTVPCLSGLESPTSELPVRDTPGKPF